MGKKISTGTIRNYRNTLRLLTDFSFHKKIYLRVRNVQKLRMRELETEKTYWKRIYKNLSEFLYEDRGYFDNYAGQCFKNLKVFCSYLNKELTIITGEFYKTFYVRKEEIPIFPLMPDELHFLIYNEKFHLGLSRRLRETRDFFVFGCTVGLRVSDLLALKQNHVRIVSGHYYLVVRSLKTVNDSVIKLPDHAMEIINRYKKNGRSLLPHFNISNLNQNIKILLEKAGFTQEVRITREKRGKTFTIKPPNRKAFRFCDVASTHTMRRTAITTMLSLGMNEQIVRRISGHAPNSKEFYRYVRWSQAFQDGETDRVFGKLKLLNFRSGS